MRPLRALSHPSTPPRTRWAAQSAYPKTKVHCVRSCNAPGMDLLTFCDVVYDGTMTGTELATIKQHICKND